MQGVSVENELKYQLKGKLSHIRNWGLQYLPALLYPWVDRVPEYDFWQMFFREYVHTVIMEHVVPAADDREISAEISLYQSSILSHRVYFYLHLPHNWKFWSLLLWACNIRQGRWKTTSSWMVPRTIHDDINTCKLQICPSEVSSLDSLFKLHWSVIICVCALPTWVCFAAPAGRTRCECCEASSLCVKVSEVERDSASAPPPDAAAPPPASAVAPLFL